MAYIDKSQLNIYFRYVYQDSVEVGVATFAGTEEVLQTTTITNDENAIRQMVNDNTCTYLKTPAGIFTEMELPIDEIWRGHEQSIIASAKLSLTRINNVLESPFSLSIPQTLLMLPKAQLQSFFEKRQIVDYQSSFLASYSSLTNSYTFSNISGLVNYMNEHRSEPD